MEWFNIYFLLFQLNKKGNTSVYGLGIPIWPAAAILQRLWQVVVIRIPANNPLGIKVNKLFCDKSSCEEKHRRHEQNLI